MKRIILFFALVLWCASTGHCQNSAVDSLTSILQNSTGEGRVEILHALITKLWVNFPDSAERYAREAIRLSGQLKSPRLRVISFRLLGGVHNYHGLYDSSVFYARKAHDLSVKINDSTLIAVSLNNMGWGYYQLGSYSEALENLSRAMRMIKQIKNEDRRFLIITNIGYVYTKLNDYETARKYFQMALRAAGNNSSVAVDVLHGTGQTYLLENNFQEAEKYFRKSLELAETVNNQSWCARAYSGLAQVFYKGGLVDSAQSNFRQSLNLYNEIRDRNGISEIYYYLSKMYSASNHLGTAFYYLNTSQRIAKQIKARDRLLENYKLYDELYVQRKRFDSALYYQSLYVELNDKKLNENSARNISDIQVKLQEEESERQIALKDAQLEGKAVQTYFSIAISILTLAFAVVVYWYYKVQKRLGRDLTIKNKKISNQRDEIVKKNEELISLSTEKNNLIGIVAHDLKSPLNQIKGLIGLIKMSPGSTDAEATGYIGMIESSTVRLTGMINKILDVEAIESRQLNLKLEEVNLSEVVHSIANRFALDAQRKKIKLHSSIAVNVIVKVDRSYIEDVVENLVSNAIKFSPADKNIYINVSTHAKKAVCEIRDEGPGLTENDRKKLFVKYQRLSALPTGEETSTGLGLSIVKKFVEAMKGEIWCESEAGKGASFFVRLDHLSVS